MHDINKNRAGTHFPAADAGDRQRQLRLVVKAGKALVTIQGSLIPGGHLPDSNGNAPALARLNGEVSPGLTASEQKPVIRQFGGPDYPCRRAAHPHLMDVEVAAVGDIVSFRHVLFHPFRGHTPSTTESPLFSGFGGLWAASFKRRLCRAGRLCLRQGCGSGNPAP